MLIVTSGWASWSVSDPKQLLEASNTTDEHAHANTGTVGYIPVHAMCRVASEARDAHHQGQITEHGYLVE